MVMNTVTESFGLIMFECGRKEWQDWPTNAYQGIGNSYQLLNQDAESSEPLLEHSPHILNFG